MFIEKKRTKFLALPICFTTYTIDEEKIRIKKGLFTIIEDDAYIYKVQDVRMSKSIMERIFGTGTLICYTGDSTHPELMLIHIKRASEIKDYIMKTSEEARIKRRTMHTLGIDADTADDSDDDE
ncbi:PH domain-containing protein [Anaeromicropila populeti]|uniref:PH domain-containing protein n=1 Tax=Anaeromicropila populeti TaxID=37658 RepID=A0A1I6IK96_9FIRM|nr:PH domain-containing protein [Anaeromicropila populeti]SFR67101.1 PH domain-containing protein [Anaeromicropila populeti]